MRPINLIPEEERGLHGGVARTGPVIYVLLGSLAVLLIGVIVLVLASNKVSEREDEIANLGTQKATISAEVSKLQPYVSFEDVAKRRLEAVTSLANSRFDWVRVVRQLALVLPPGSSLKNLAASSGGNSGGGPLAVETPAVILNGCAPSQDGTAAVITALKQIDGVTRVGLAKSARGGESSEGEEECAPGFTQFEITAAFDEAPISPDVSGGEAITETAPIESGAAEEAESTSETEGEESEVSGETANSGESAPEEAG